MCAVQKYDFFCGMLLVESVCVMFLMCVVASGDRCEVVREVCTRSSQCQNGGKCVSGQCMCPAGFSGLLCEQG